MSARNEGFALLSVVWLIIALGALTLSLIVPLVQSQRASANRMSLVRARWAAHGCASVLRARRWQDRSPSDSIALGTGVWCEISSVAPDERVNPNVVDSAALTRLLANPVRVASLLDWIDADDDAREAGAESEWYRARLRRGPGNGPLADPLELRLVRGFEDAPPWELDERWTTTGNGTVSANRASPWVLTSLSGVPAELPRRLLVERQGERRFQSAEEVVVRLALEPTITEFQQMVRQLTFDEFGDVFRATGFSRRGSAVLAASVIVVLSDGDPPRDPIGSEPR